MSWSISSPLKLRYMSIIHEDRIFLSSLSSHCMSHAGNSPRLHSGCTWSFVHVVAPSFERKVA